jgi:hypothetical protein
LNENGAAEVPSYRESVNKHLANQRKPKLMNEELCAHRDLRWNYSFWRPRSWHRFDMQDRYGFIYSPSQDPRTGFHISVLDLSGELDEPVQKEDLPAIREGLLKRMRKLPDCEIEYGKDIVRGPALGLEVMYTFSLDGESCKRQSRLLYNGWREFTLLSQGVPAEQYDQYQDHFTFMLSTFVFRDLLAGAGNMPLSPENDPVVWQGGPADPERSEQ